MQTKTCPRCGSPFICQPENPTQCQCAGIQLRPEIHTRLNELYPNSCLCRRCLKALCE